MDPDNDGWCNLLEYALGSDPHTSGKPPGAPVFGQAGGYLTITFQRNPFLSDISYLVESSSALSGGWTTIAQSVAGAATAAASGQTPSQVTRVAGEQRHERDRGRHRADGWKRPAFPASARDETVAARQRAAVIGDLLWVIGG